MTAPTSARRPVIFLGPSMAHEKAVEIVDADYRRPARRGDIAAVAAPGAIIGLIDGVFEAYLAVSLGEVAEAVARGATVVGGASMGALRAAEVPGTHGVGTVYEWYRDGRIHRDDEVALLFDPDTGTALTVPTVNVRHAAERLCRADTIDRDTADRIVAAAACVPYKERTYKVILRAAGLGDVADLDQLVALLEQIDLKQSDAHRVLEVVGDYVAGRAVRADTAADPARWELSRPGRPGADDGILIWESGDRVCADDLVRFLAATGRLLPVVERLVATDVRGNEPTAPAEVPTAQERFVDAVRRWGWVSEEEAEVTLGDLGLDLRHLQRRIDRGSHTTAAAAQRLRERGVALASDVVAELFLDNASLKREVLRAGSFKRFRCRDHDPVNDDERRQARQVLARLHGVFDNAQLQRRWAMVGLGDLDGFVDDLARARRAARPLRDAMAGRVGAPQDPLNAMLRDVPAAPKPPGERRFAEPMSVAADHAVRLRQLIGVSRVGMIGELTDLDGVHVAQVARPGGEWSSSYGSGKALTPEGAVVGGTMEELEKWSQERFAPDPADLVVGSFAALRTTEPVVDPASFDLPWDSGYRADQPLRWNPCADLAGGGHRLVPIDLLTIERQPYDICFTSRGDRKHFTTNGLASGFAVAEAMLHGLCEIVERHALRLAELVLSNPGGLGPVPWRFIETTTLPDRLQDIVDRVARGTGIVRILDITSDVAIPTFLGVSVRDGQRAEGSAAHPDPSTAIEMALLEVGQTIASAVAGAREDLSTRARSLGRHERPRPVFAADAWFWQDHDTVGIPIDAVPGATLDDVRADLVWALGCVNRAGLPHCLALDLGRPEIRPAHVVRILVPGLESNNPFFTGERARLELLRDMLPRWR